MKIVKFNENLKKVDLDEIMDALVEKFEEIENYVGPYGAYYLKNSDIIEMVFEFTSIEEDALLVLLDIVEFVRQYDDVNFYMSPNKVDRDLISVAFYINNISEDSFIAMGKDLDVELTANKYNI